MRPVLVAVLAACGTAVLMVAPLYHQAFCTPAAVLVAPGGPPPPLPGLSL